MELELTLEQLKNIAIKLNYDHHPNLGIVKLTDGLTKHAEEVGTTIKEVAIDLGYIKVQPETQEPQTTLKDDSDNKDPEVGQPGIDPDEPEYMKQLRNFSFATAEQDKAKKDEKLATREATRLIRCILTTVNKNKTSYQGEIFAVQNAFVPEQKKMIPFNVPCINKIRLFVYNEASTPLYKLIQMK